MCYPMLIKQNRGENIKMKHLNNTMRNDKELKTVVGGKNSKDLGNLLLIQVGDPTEHATIATRGIDYLRRLSGWLLGWIYG